MEWPLRKSSRRENERFSREAWAIPFSRTPDDPTIVWGTDVDVSALERFLATQNRGSTVLISPAHVLIRAVARTLVQHPEFNRRLLGRRIYGFKEVNVLMPIRHARERRADIVLLRNIDRRSLAEIAADLWQQVHEAARGEFRYDPQTRLYRNLPRLLRRHLLRFQVWLNNNWNLPADLGSERQRCAAVLINYLGFDGAAPLRSFKPSRFPAEGFPFSITMGRTELRPVTTAEGTLAVRPLAPVFVRADRRLVDPVQVGQFVQTLRETLGDPERLMENTPASPELSPASRSATNDFNGEDGPRRPCGNDRPTSPR